MKLHKPSSNGPVLWFTEAVRQLLLKEQGPVRRAIFALEQMVQAGQAHERPAYVTLPDLSCHLLLAAREAEQGSGLVMECGQWERRTVTLTHEQAVDSSVRPEGILFHGRGTASTRVTFPSAARRASLEMQATRRDVRRGLKPNEDSATALVFRLLQSWLDAADTSGQPVVARITRAQSRPAQVLKVLPNLTEGTLKLVLWARGRKPEAVVLHPDALDGAILSERHASFYAGMSAPLHVYVSAGADGRGPSNGT